MSDFDNDNNGALLIFAKSPEAGTVKTRLIPDIGISAATDLYKELLQKTLITAQDSIFIEKQLWFNGNKHNSFFNNYSGLFRFMEQSGNDLGERMFNAFEYTLKKYEYAVLIGCDCPGLTCNDLKIAAELLKTEKDIVLGPAEDGGYYLIGLSRNHIELFTDIEWGSETVFSKTISIAKKLHLHVGLLEKRQDVDRVSDLLSAYKNNKKQTVLD